MTNKLINKDMNKGENKVVLILEKSISKLDIIKDEKNDIFLEGIFAQFGIINNNDRLYEESEYLPHLEYLNKKISEKRLLGELDHPEKFDVSLAKVSHIIESLEYDRSKRQLKGRIRLLDTPQGRIAKELVESGIPICISSRAAGLVESNKKVKIKKIFTYDLVQDPGFENAVLSRINESLGIVNENIAIYDVTSSYPSMLEEYSIVSDNKTKNTDNMEYVTSEELNTYSLILKEELEQINGKLSGFSEYNEMSEKVSKLCEAVSRLETYSSYISNTLNNSIQYGEYIGEKVEQIIDYTDYVSKTLDESVEFNNKVSEKVHQVISFSNYLSENVNHSIGYGEHVAEQVDKSIEYAEYLKECLEKGVNYSEYIGEQLNKGISYSEYVAENATYELEDLTKRINETIEYSNYLSEQLNNGVSYSEYIGEQTQHLADYTEFTLNEKKISKENSDIKISNEIIKESTTTDYSSLTEKVNKLIESIKKQKIDSATTALDEAKKQKVSKAIGESNQVTSNSVLNQLLVENQETIKIPETESKVENKWLTEAPAEYKTIWESLDQNVKNIISSQSKFYKLESPYQIKNFWQTRKIETPVILNEVVDTKKEDLGYSTTYMNSISSQLDKYRRY